MLRLRFPMLENASLNRIGVGRFPASLNDPQSNEVTKPISAVKGSFWVGERTSDVLSPTQNHDDCRP